MKMDNQRQDYGSKKGETGGKSKVISTEKMPMLKAGGESGSGSGPTGSSRSYPPKGDRMPGSLNGEAMNPMNVKTEPTYGVAGVGGKD